jgi:hypothetical protein
VHGEAIRRFKNAVIDSFFEIDYYWSENDDPVLASKVYEIDGMTIALIKDLNATVQFCVYDLCFTHFFFFFFF